MFYLQCLAGSWFSQHPSPRKYRGGLLFALLLLLNGCTSTEMLVSVEHHNEGATIDSYNLSTHKRSLHIFNAIDITSEVKAKQLQKRVQHLIVLIDESTGMDEQYRDVPRGVYANEILRRLLKTLPDTSLTGGVISFKNNLAISGWLNNIDREKFIKSPPNFDAQKILEQLDANKSFPAINAGHLAIAIDKVSDIVSRLEGRTALVIISQWEKNDKAVAEAIMRLRQKTQFTNGHTIAKKVEPWAGKSGDGLCIYSIGVGNNMSRTRYDISDTCGASFAADKIAQPRDMAHLVKRILFTQPMDDDLDGIFNYLDHCPNTPQGRLVNYDGCSLFSTEAQ